MSESKLRTDWDVRIIDAVSVGLVKVGESDDVARLQALIEEGPSEDKLKTACEIAIAWIRFAQDLKSDLGEILDQSRDGKEFRVICMKYNCQCERDHA